MVDIAKSSLEAIIFILLLIFLLCACYFLREKGRVRGEAGGGGAHLNSVGFT